MRLIASFEEEKKAYALYSLLLKANIESVYEPLEDPVKKILKYPVWIINEEDFERSLEIYDEFEKDSERFLKQEMDELSSSEDNFSESALKAPIKIHATSQFVRVRHQASLTRLIIIVCVFLFLWNGYQKILLNKESPELVTYFGLTTLTMNLMYDDPPIFQEMYQFFIQHPNLKIAEMDQWTPELREEFKNLDKKPFWKGIYPIAVNWATSKSLLEASLFTKIKEGEVWRLFTPAVLHGNFLHILFNMLWLWLLGKQVELKIGKIRYLALMILIGVIANTAQYLLSGPLFLGYSGIICGLGGFIWVRQKKAPWEGYNVPRGTLLFLFVFIVGMFLLQAVALVISKMHLGDFSVGQIGNTAHIVGLMCGLLFGRIPIFYRLTS